MKHITLLLVVLMLLSSACTSTRTSGGELAIPSQWKLESFGESGAETPIIEGSTITLEFEENGQAGGNGGCNSYGVTYEMQGDSLMFKDVTSTLMACADDQVTQQEQAYFKALGSATRYELSGDNLTILYGDGQGKLNFVKETSG